MTSVCDLRMACNLNSLSQQKLQLEKRSTSQVAVRKPYQDIAHNDPYIDKEAGNFRYLANSSFLDSKGVHKSQTDRVKFLNRQTSSSALTKTGSTDRIKNYYGNQIQNFSKRKGKSSVSTLCVLSSKNESNASQNQDK